MCVCVCVCVCVCDTPEPVKVPYNARQLRQPASILRSMPEIWSLTKEAADAEELPTGSYKNNKIDSILQPCGPDMNRPEVNSETDMCAETKGTHPLCVSQNINPRPKEAVSAKDAVRTKGPYSVLPCLLLHCCLPSFNGLAGYFAKTLYISY